MRRPPPIYGTRVTAEILKDARAIAGLTGEELAEKAGIGYKTLASFESGSRTFAMKLGQFLAILAACDVTLVEFARAYETGTRLLDMDRPFREGGAAASGQGNHRPGERMEGPR